MEETITFVWYESPEIWAAILSVGFAIISGFVVLLTFKKKNSIVAKFQKDVEGYKSELNIRFELLRIKESQAHTTKLEAIKCVYVKLVELHEMTQILNMRLIPSNWGTEEEIGERLFNKFKELNAEWLPNKLFFTKEIADRIDGFIGKCFRNGDQNLFNRAVIKSDPKFLQKELDKLRKEAEIELPAIMESIESDFRNIIGVETKS